MRIPPVGDNAGLALARSVPWPAGIFGQSDQSDRTDKNEERRRFFDQVAALKTSAAYEDALRRWKGIMEARNAVTFTATLGGPLAVGLGNGSPFEVGLTLHRIYGVPIIPGSGIKGACWSAARKNGFTKPDRANALANADKAALSVAEEIFGTNEVAGACIFHDAWYDPASVGGTPLAVDTITVHHQKYYQSKGVGEVYPTDFDDPNPVPFVSVRPGAKFYFAVEVPGGQDWRDFVFAMVSHTLGTVGLGGKTNAGYGWFEPYRPPTPEEILAEFRPRIDGIKAQTLSDIEQILARADNREARAIVAEAIRQKLESIGRWKDEYADKRWYKAIKEALQ